MIENFPLLRQPLGSNACLTTAVRAVLIWYGEQVSQEEVSEWCGETEAGCWLDQAMEGLRSEGFDVEELTEDIENLLRMAVTDEEDPQPVIVTLQPSFGNSPLDHAVVLVGVEQRQGEEGKVEVVQFMDPLTGTIEEDITGTFWIDWDFAGGHAFILRP